MLPDARWPNIPFLWAGIKNENVYFFAERGPGLEPVTVEDVWRWHIPPTDTNLALTKSLYKYSSRMQLCFSNIFPTFPVSIRLVDDVISKDGQTMTDGCGFAHPALFRRVAYHLDALDDDTESFPSALQIRVAGFKGLIVVNPDLDDPFDDVVYLRKSMHKVQQSYPTDTQRRLEVVTWSRPRAPAYLNGQIITLLEAGGVPIKSLLELLELYLDRIYKLRTEPSISRLKGRALAPGVDISRMGFEREAVEMMSAGLHGEHRLLFLLREIQKYHLHQLRKTMKIRVPLSRLLLAAADPTDGGRLLQRNEVYINISGVGIIVGDVLLTRNPCWHPGDVVIRKAVALKAGNHCLVYKDVVLCNVHDDRATLNILAGGEFSFVPSQLFLLIHLIFYFLPPSHFQRILQHMDKTIFLNRRL